MKIGVLVGFKNNIDIESKMKELRQYDFNCCQISCWDPKSYTKENAERIKAAAAENEIEITALWAGWTGPCEWNFSFGPSTIGLVPPAYRAHRLDELIAASNFAEMLGVTDVVTHVGFIPENPDSPDFVGTVGALRKLAKIMEKKGQYFLFETGQETPVTMLRTIEAIGTPNLGINFDTANLILYGKANSADAIDTFGKYIRNTHLKDGLYPTSGSSLGKQVQIGEGKADIPLLMKKLVEIGYNGPWIIEREISGPKQIEDIVASRKVIVEVLEALNVN